MGVHQRVPHRGPVVVAMIQIADPRLFLVVARLSAQDRRMLSMALSPPISFGHFDLRTCRLAGFPCICSSARCRCSGCRWSRQRTAQADAARRFGIRGIEAFGSRNGRSQIDDVLERRIGFLRVGGWRLHETEKLYVLVDQRLEAASKYAGGIPSLLGPPILDGSTSVRSL